MAILTGHEIRKQVAVGNIVIDPYDEERVQPNSVDLTLGAGVCVYTAVTESLETRGVENSYEHSLWLRSKEVDRSYAAFSILDSRADNPFVRFSIDESGWLVKPGIMYLMHTVEQSHARNYVMELTGKSSIGRLSVIVHYTAAHAETGFYGQWTLEVSAMHPVKIYAGMPIAQVLFHTVEGEIEDYRKKGNYVGQGAQGAVPSRSWKQK